MTKKTTTSNTKRPHLHWSIRVRHNGNYIDTGDYASKAAAIRAVPTIRQQYPSAKFSLVVCTHNYIMLSEKIEYTIPKKASGLHL